jgi:hypothetical protein
MQKTFNDMTLTTMGFVKVLHMGKHTPNGEDRFWLCDCQLCGKLFWSRGKDIRRGGETMSCGCRRYSRESQCIHGYTGTPLYDKWRGMRSRCANGPSYIKKGIKVCAEWESDFEAFKRDMGPGFSEGLSLERKNPKGDYCKDNCTWIPLNEQHYNKTTSIIIEYKGAPTSLCKVARLAGLPRQALYQRFKKGETGEMLTRPVRPCPKRKRTAEELESFRTKYRATRIRNMK